MSEHTFNTPAFSHAIKWLIAVAVLAAGAYLSVIDFMGHEWLTRAGCLVVMLGIWSALGGIVEERLLNTRIQHNQRNAIVRAKAELLESNADTGAIEKELARINEMFEAQRSHAAGKLRMSVGFQEVSLLLTGTFVWGFGDLLCC